MPPMDLAARLLAAYDDQLRTDAETPSATAVHCLGPLRLVTFAGGHGMVTYRDLGAAAAMAETDPAAAASAEALHAAQIRRWVREALEHYRADAGIQRVEWKTRGHDQAPGLHEALLDHGFVAEACEAIMVGEARMLLAGAPLPTGVRMRRITSASDVSRMTAMQADVFGDHDPAAMTEAILRRLARADGMELWIAEAAGEVVSAGRLEPVAGSDFAGIWGGATRPAWRGKGIYRALTAARARSALALGKTLIHSDSTEFSRPILERAGLLKVSTTTPYTWKR